MFVDAATCRQQLLPSALPSADTFDVKPLIGAQMFTKLRCSRTLACF